ncbi:protein serine/threonine phosphatase 2C [Fomitopsis serialis]|uniref:protein serine/threonine phosphatase 2C n=1 Tax=Fomitopsis serialis TaxID=139415 RepID=UPI002007BF1E|nr:protein serine/threonine phosphatase 2C [Neoantrodia serialis]KAH9934743.1 protein serine/threonine phosphatase 2C [Neoantrodia serialis]
MSLGRSITQKTSARLKSTRRAYSSLPRPYRFHVGASWAGKPPDPQMRRLKTKPFAPDSDIGGWRDSLLDKYHSPVGNHVGEDFFYVQDVSLHMGRSIFLTCLCMYLFNGVSFGVADGVGGWVDSGVDPSLFSQALMYHAHRYSKDAWAGEPETDPTQDLQECPQVEGWEMSPAECLELAYGGVLRERSIKAGSSTACLLTLNAASGVLRAANLGDSGFSIFRSSNLIHQQRSQQHFFNCPKQLSKLPQGIPGFSRAVVDSPREADILETKLRDGDIVIVYTDGLADNVFPAEMSTICTLVSRQFSDDKLVQTIAERLVEYATACMKKKNRASPFERAAAREGMYFRGGVSYSLILGRMTLTVFSPERGRVSPPT